MMTLSNINKTFYSASGEEKAIFLVDLKLP